MSISRRSFFAKLAGAVVATKVLPPVPVWGSTGGAHVGALREAIAKFHAFGQDAPVVLHGCEPVITLEQAAKWFNVPRELIAPMPSPLARTSDELLEDSAVDIGAWMRRLA